jgi:DNA-binding protein YbaB
MTAPQMPRLPVFAELAAAARENAERIAAEHVTTTAADGSISVTATGAGAILEVRVHPLALRQLDNITLAERVQEVANAALEQAEALRPSSATSPLDGIDAKLAMFEHRMDGLLERLDRIARDLDR